MISSVFSPAVLLFKAGILGPDIVSLCSYHTVVQKSRGTCYFDLLLSVFWMFC